MKAKLQELEKKMNLGNQKVNKETQTENLFTKGQSTQVENSQIEPRIEVSVLKSNK